MDDSGFCSKIRIRNIDLVHIPQFWVQVPDPETVLAGLMGRSSVPEITGELTMLRIMWVIPTCPENSLVVVNSPTLSYLSVATFALKSGTLGDRSPVKLYRISWIVKAATNLVPECADLIQPLAVWDILVLDRICEYLCSTIRTDWKPTIVEVNSLNGV